MSVNNSPQSPVRDRTTPTQAVSTPLHSRGQIRAGITHTPLVLGTPRTPSQGTPLAGRSPASSVSSISRGDVGRGLGRAVFIPPPPLHFSAANDFEPNSPRAEVELRNTGLNNSQDMYVGLPGDSPLPADRAGARAVPNPANEPQLIDAEVWGTNISVKSTANTFKYFVETFTLDDEFEPYYLRQMEIMHRTEVFVLNISCKHLHSNPSTAILCKQLLQSPQELIPIMDAVANEIFISNYGEREGQPKIQVRVHSLSEISRMRELDPAQIETLIAIKGMVVRTSQVIPDLTQAFFRCCSCAYTVEIMIDRGRIDEPTSCMQCQMQGSMALVHNRSLFMDKQLIRLQETPDEVPEGETPSTVSLCVYGDLVDSVRPGDRVEVTGIFRALPRRINPKHRVVKSVYRTYVDVIHFRASEKMEAGNPSSSTKADAKTADDQFPPERIKEFEMLARQGDVYDRLVNAFAPSIWEMDDVKRGILCLLFGGTYADAKKTAAALQRQRKSQQADFGEHVCDALLDDGFTDDEVKRDVGAKNTAKIRQRGDINILLCGDPGTSKSQMLSYVHKLTPRGIYTSGKGSSAVGLTASVVKDPETKEMVLESGALVLSDNGICCIDEFDKMDDTTRAILHEAMEQQTVSITKAGIVANLNARTSILASANPVESRYNARRSVVENIKLPPTLLSRFDLIYLILDKPNPESDRRLARHLVSLYHATEANTPSTTNSTSIIDQQFLRDYIAYARGNIAPEIGSDAVETLVQGYLNMRSLGGNGGKTISATPRQLESLIRISQALAKMRLCTSVTNGDVEEAIRLMKVATQTAATDPRTGTIDMDMITTGRTALDRDVILKLAGELRTVFSSRSGQRLTVGQIRQLLLKNSQVAGSDSNVSMTEIEEAVRELETENVVQFVERTQTVIIRAVQ